MANEQEGVPEAFDAMLLRLEKASFMAGFTAGVEWCLENRPITKEKIQSVDLAGLECFAEARQQILQSEDGMKDA